MAGEMNIEELKDAMKKNKKFTLLDVRRREDFHASPKKIPGARWEDPEKADTWISSYAKDRPAVVYCVKGGGVSQSVAEKMAQIGIETRFLKGGIRDWAENGLPVE